MLQERFVHIKEGSDILRWGYNQKGTFSIKEAYDIRSSNGEAKDLVWKKIWETNPWSKVSIFY